MSDLATSTASQNLPDNVTHADEQPAVVYLAGLAPGSRRAMAQALNVIAQIVTGDEKADYLAIPWHYLRFQHTAAIRAHLEVRYAHSTANKMLSALRGTLRAAWKLGLMSAEEYHKAASVESVKGETLPAGRAIAQGELVGLLNTCDRSPTGVRDAALLAVLYGCGLRRAEAVALNLEDYDEGEGTLRIRGKGNKQRLSPVVGGAAAALADWLALRGRRPGPLFWGTGNRNQKRRLTTQAVYK
ncbi:MAG: tyrosine-type recombinase/integrase, partial [Anaerolineales bacterium]|nr:tyrosine-type recombinase/integrase [Anaerolineales bacterium]